MVVVRIKTGANENRGNAYTPQHLCARTAGECRLAPCTTGHVLVDEMEDLYLLQSNVAIIKRINISTVDACRIALNALSTLCLQKSVPLDVR